MFCASVAAQRGARVAIIDHSERLAEKIRISGGGRCNFTNVEAHRSERFISADPRFARAALQAYRPSRFIALVRQHGIAFHEKHRGQLFCDDSSERIIQMLVAECAAGAVSWLRPCSVAALRPLYEREAHSARFELGTSAGALRCRSLVVASGGLSIPKIGASDFAYRIARQFDLAQEPTRPGLVPMTFDGDAWQPLSALAGLATEVDIGNRAAVPMPKHAIGRFREDMLFTHRGLSGPAILQISNYWRDGETLSIDLAKGIDVHGRLLSAKRHGRTAVSTELAQLMPKRLAQQWLAQSPFAVDGARRVGELSNQRLAQLAAALRDWRVQPTGTEGYRKAEVTLGGIAVSELAPDSLQSLRIAGLYFIGEAVDVTGWLGGYNFQWAWASGYGAAMSATAGGTIAGGTAAGGTAAAGTVARGTKLMSAPNS